MVPEILELRYYQRDAVDAVYCHLRDHDDNPCVVIPTAGGKTPIMATICKDVVTRWGGRVLVLAHVKELVQQTSNHLADMAPDLLHGINSAGLGSRDKHNAIIVAGIQSVFRDVSLLGRFDIIMIDEAHLIPTEGEGMYRSLLKDAKIINPKVRMIGLTATPYRMKGGIICKPQNILNQVCYEKSVRDLIEEGFICRPISKRGSKRGVADTSGLHKRGGEFIDEEVQAVMDTNEMVEAAAADIIARSQGRKATLIFCSGVDHAEHMQRVMIRRLTEQGYKDAYLEVRTVFGHDIKGLRDETIREFKAGVFDYLINVSVLVTGFDYPALDHIGLARITNSPVFYKQMVGRGFRLHPGKENFLVSDYGENIWRHGPVDQVQIQEGDIGDGDGDGVAPTKECPECRVLLPTATLLCPECGFEFPKPEVHHATQASGQSILADLPEGRFKDCTAVMYQRWDRHQRADEEAKPVPTLRVDYVLEGEKWPVSEWVCLEHEGYAREKAAQWWAARSEVAAPVTVDEAVELAQRGALADISEVKISRGRGDKYAQIEGFSIGPKPTGTDGWSDDEEKDLDCYFDMEGNMKVEQRTAKVDAGPEEEMATDSIDSEGFDWARGEQVR